MDITQEVYNLRTVVDRREEIRLEKAGDEVNRGGNVGKEANEGVTILAQSTEAAHTKAWHQKKGRYCWKCAHFNVRKENKNMFKF